MRFWKRLKPGLLAFGSSALCAFAEGRHTAAPVLPKPAQVFDRYVQAAGGTAAWHAHRSEQIEIEGRDPESDGIILKATLTASRNGNTLRQVHIPQEASEGVYNGVAWAWTALSGPRIKHGEERALALRGTRILEEADWKSLYPKSTVDGGETVAGKLCYRVSLLPSPDQRMEWFDLETGLLVRRAFVEPSADGDTPVTETVESWTWADGVLQPAVLMVDRGGLRYRIKVLSFAANRHIRNDFYKLPPQVETYLAADKAGRALPSAEEIIERHIFVSGGAAAFQALKSQKISGTLDYLATGLSARTETWSATGGRYYQSVDVPGLGRQEEGSDGRVAWERSPTLGPRAKPKAALAGLGVTIDAAEVAAWRLLVKEVRTEALDTVDGRECYRLRVLGRDGRQVSIRWYQKSNGLLYRSTMPLQTAMGQLPAVLTYEAYRRVAGFQWPVVIRVTAAGQDLLFRAAEVALNTSLDTSVFQLPEEIRALAAAKQKDAPGDAP